MRIDAKDVQVHLCDEYLIITSEKESYLMAHNDEKYGWTFATVGHHHWYKDDLEEDEHRVCTLEELVAALKVVQSRKDKP